MSEKQFEHIENRIREAAANSEPDFDEYAWSLMEARLDKEDNRKRPFLFWGGLLALLLIIGGSVYFIGNNKTAEKLTLQQAHLPIIEDGSPQQKNASTVIPPVGAPVDEVDSKIGLNNKWISPEVEASKLTRESNISAKLKNTISDKKRGKTKGKMVANNSAGEISDIENRANGNDATETIPDKAGIDKIADNKVNDGEPQLMEKKDNSLKNSNTVMPQKNSKEKEAKEAKPTRFYFLAALGADVGSVHFLSFSNSEVSPKYGVGIGYQFSKKISLQTGFYASNKKYVAGPDDYNTKAGTYWNIVQIVKVDAACLVYDIPLTLRYDFIQKPKISYYATVGLSSYIMKKEAYDYYYIRYNMPHEAAKTYTGNKNIFSVINLSAGLEKKLSPVFSIQAEPSFGIPLSGVGEGSVKLYSAAMQVGIKYQPLKKKK